MSGPFTDNAIIERDPHALALGRSKRLSHALKQAAGHGGASLPATPAGLSSRLAWFVQPPRAAINRPIYRFTVPYRSTFVVVVIIPSLIALFYFSLIASGQFVSEMKFSVRAGEKVTIDAASSMTQAQDTLIVQNYLTSRALVEELEKRVGLREIFSRPGIDWWSRFDPDSPIEDLVRYWRQRASSSIEAVSGIVSITVRAFTPDDSFRTARAVLELGEALVNEMSTRSRQDLVAQSEVELQRAEARLKTVRVTQQNLRNQEGMLDPTKQAEAINRLLSDLRLDRIRLENELATTKPSLSEGAPQVQILRSRIRALSEQVVNLEGKLTSESGSDPTIARSMTRFDEVEMEHKVAQAQYVSAAAALERARGNAERQGVYLAAFVQPVIPQEARYPRRFWSSLGFAAVAFLLWAIGTSIATLVRDHMA